MTRMLRRVDEMEQDSAQKIEDPLSSLGRKRPDAGAGLDGA